MKGPIPGVAMPQWASQPRTLRLWDVRLEILCHVLLSPCAGLWLLPYSCVDCWFPQKSLFYLELFPTGPSHSVSYSQSQVAMSGMLAQTDSTCFCVCRSPPSPPPREFTYVNATAPVQQQPIYENGEVSPSPGPRQVERAREEAMGSCLLVKPGPAVLRPPPQIDGPPVLRAEKGVCLKQFKWQEEGTVS